jgi:hypothetical protein
VAHRRWRRHGKRRRRSPLAASQTPPPPRHRAGQGDVNSHHTAPATGRQFSSRERERERERLLCSILMCTLQLNIAWWSIKNDICKQITCCLIFPKGQNNDGVISGCLFLRFVVVFLCRGLLELMGFIADHSGGLPMCFLVGFIMTFGVYVSLRNWN